MEGLMFGPIPLGEWGLTAAIFLYFVIFWEPRRIGKREALRADLERKINEESKKTIVALTRAVTKSNEVGKLVVAMLRNLPGGANLPDYPDIEDELSHADEQEQIESSDTVKGGGPDG